MDPGPASLKCSARPVTWRAVRYALTHLVDEGQDQLPIASGRRTSTISKRRFTLRRCQSTKRWKRLGSFPKKQILTREQAKFIIWCLTYDRIKQRAKGSRYHTYGLLTKLAKTFGVTPECIVQIDKRRIWRSINRPKPKQQFFIKGARGDSQGRRREERA